MVAQWLHRHNRSRNATGSPLGRQSTFFRDCTAVVLRRHCGDGGATAVLVRYHGGHGGAAAVMAVHRRSHCGLAQLAVALRKF